MPEHWSPMTTDEDFEAVQLDTRSKEYQQVANKLLSAAKANLTIKRIERIQNLFKYKKYMLTKLKMEERKHGGSNEKHLFHGTSSKSFTSINKEGFDRGYAGIHGEYHIVPYNESAFLVDLITFHLVLEVITYFASPLPNWCAQPVRKSCCEVKFFLLCSFYSCLNSYLNFSSNLESLTISTAHSLFI